MAVLPLILLSALSAAVSLPLNGWVATDDAVASSEPMTIRFALHAARPTALDDALVAVSDPKSQRFRQYLTDVEVAELVAPADEAAQAVTEWARAELGVEAVLSLHGEYVLASAPVGKLHQAFAGILNGFSLYRHSESNLTKVRMLAADTSASPAAFVPSELRAHVWAVLDLVELLPVPPKKVFTSGEPGDKIDPSVIQKQYGLTNAESIGGKTPTSQGVAAFEQAQFNPSDVAAFEDHYKLPKVAFQILGPNDGGYFGEAGLDTQYIVSSGRGVPSWFIAQDAFDMVAWCEKVLSMPKPPAVLSISWGSGESNYQAEHMKAASTCFQKMGVKGMSVFVASGDAGTGKQGFFSCKKFDANWPASCPYVTAVGGTFLESNQEQGWSGSGGGFSAVFPRSSFQDAAVKAYMSNATLPPSDLYVSSGRALPDVSALSTNYQVFSGGAIAGTLTGTSAATPTFAGMVSVVNDLLVASGKPTVGFVNPALYAAAAAGDPGFLGFDVTAGNNKNGGCRAGFPATAGWDAVTGLGTPNWARLKAALGLKTQEDIVV